MEDGVMKVHRILLLADAVRVVEDQTGILYFPGEFSGGMWKRYMNFCDVFVVVCRKCRGIINSETAKRNYEEKPEGNIEVCCVKDKFESIKSYFSLSVKKYNCQLIEREIKKSDAVIVRTFSSMSAGMFHRIINKYHKKVLVESVGCSWDAMWNHGVRGKILAPYSFFTTRKIIRNADYVCYVTDFFLQKRYPAMGKQIAVSDVDIPDTDVQVLDERREKIRNHKGKFKIATVGSVDVDYKGQKFVIQALAELKKHGNNQFEYYCIGGGNSRKLKILAERLGISERVFFPGAMLHDKVMEFLDEMDIYIQPSLLEGLPRSLVEAMSRGLPAFGSKAGGIPELLDEKCMFKRKEVGQIADILESVNEKMLLEWSERNFEAAKKYEPSKNNQRRIQFYREYIIECSGN